ncbi:hypothetical protein CYMTET_19482 [Cymbomonas tetramitiformis]|uniref:Uncharacterized protein n=1 Tax=Cymbomonas tetramitiformis TaxID=36881 RepID=A0AAE0G5X0_9CHLO|nr:hypothetical protein CYMTET_19482 [Cymbomonas tetramitiformis]
MGASKEVKAYLQGAEVGDEEVSSCDGLQVVKLSLPEVALQDGDAQEVKTSRKAVDLCFTFDLQDGYHLRIDESCAGCRPAARCGDAGQHADELLLADAGERSTTAQAGSEGAPLYYDFLVLASSRFEAVHPRDLEVRRLCEVLPVSVPGCASGEAVSQGTPLRHLHQEQPVGEDKDHTSGVERRLVAQAAGSEPVERAQDLKEPHKGAAAHGFLPAHLGRSDLRLCLQGSKVKVYWPIDDAWCQGTVGLTSENSSTRAAYEDGDEGHPNTSKEKYEMVPAGIQQQHSGQLQPSNTAEAAVWLFIAYLMSKTTVKAGAPDTGVAMLRTHICIGVGAVSVVLHKENGKRHVRLTRRLTIPAAGVQLLQHWKPIRDAPWVAVRGYRASMRATGGSAATGGCRGNGASSFLLRLMAGCSWHWGSWVVSLRKGNTSLATAPAMDLVPAPGQLGRRWSRAAFLAGGLGCSPLSTPTLNHSEVTGAAAWHMTIEPHWRFRSEGFTLYLA